MTTEGERKRYSRRRHIHQHEMAKSMQQHPEVDQTKDGTIHASLQNGKITKQGNLKTIDEAATGNAPVLDIEMSEVLAPPDNAERRIRLQQQQTRNADQADSTPKQDSVF